MRAVFESHGTCLNQVAGQLRRAHILRVNPSRGSQVFISKLQVSEVFQVFEC